NQAFRFGGEGGIRTPVTLPGELDFESSAFSRARPPLRFGLLPLTLSQTAKKGPKNCRTIFSQRPTDNWQSVVQSNVVAKLIQRFHRTAFGIKTTKNESPDPRLHDGPHTHNTGLERHIKLAIRQSPVTKMTRRLLDG